MPSPATTARAHARARSRKLAGRRPPAADARADRAFDKWVDATEGMLSDLEVFFEHERRASHRRMAHGIRPHAA